MKQLESTIEVRQRAEIENIVRTAIANLITPRTVIEIKDSDKFIEDFGIDGMDRGGMLSVVRAKFGIDFTFGEVKQIITFGDLVKAVVRHCSH